MTTKNKPNVGFWIIAIIALIWNIMGVMEYLMAQYKTESYRVKLTTDQLEFIDAVPVWSTALFALAVFGGLLGSFCLLIRKKWATPLFLISFVTALINIGYSFFATNHAELFGTVGGIVMPLIIIVIAIFLYLYSKSASTKGWLR